MLGRDRPVERTVGRQVTGPPQPDGESSHGRLARTDVGTETRRLREPIARPRGIHGGKLVPERRDEIAFGARHIRPFD
jgi:hypothetical protein